MRINKRLSELGICSRREADKLIAEGRITVNHAPIQMGQQVTEADSIEIDGESVNASQEKPTPVLLAYYKPRGIVCTSSDKDKAPNIVDAIHYPVRIYPIGRLDKESEGLILMTNQGELVNRINRARYQHEKEYVVTVDKPLNKMVLDQLADGVYLKELEVKTRPCEVWQNRALPPKQRAHQFHIVLTQGMNRQIRRMCAELGYTVKKLKRIRIMNVRLEGLRPGEYREISADELGLPAEESGAPAAEPKTLD